MDLSQYSTDELKAMLGDNDAHDAKPRELSAPDLSNYSTEQLQSALKTAEPVSWGDWLEQGGADVAKSFGSGVVRGLGSMAGTVGDVEQLGRAGLRYAGSDVSPDPYFATSAEYHKGIEENLPYLSHKPETTAGEYAQAAGEFAPYALPGSGTGEALVGAGRAALERSLPKVASDLTRAGARFTGSTVAPSAASEFAGEQTKDSWLEPYARIGGSLLGSGVAPAVRSLTGIRAGAGDAIKQATRGVTPEHIDQAEKLIADARAMGIDLTRAEALQHVTGGATGLGDVQRIAESSGEMMPFFAQRPTQVEGATRKLVTELAPDYSAPSAIGPSAHKEASKIVRQAERDVSKESGPLYEKAAQNTVPDAAIESAVSKIDKMIDADTTKLTHPELTRLKSQLEDSRDIENLDRIRKNIRDRMALPKGSQDALSKEMGAKLLSVTKPLNEAMETASPAFKEAKLRHAQASDRILAPILAGPIGRLANKDMTTRDAINALFPGQPIAGTEHEIADAVTRLASKNEPVARQLVRAHIESTFNKAVKDLVAGRNQAGGANFVAQLMGNRQAEKNLYSAIESLPGGAETRAGVERLMDVLRATGQRQAAGSRTAFNTEALKNLSSGSLPAEAAVTLGTGIPRALRDRFDRWAIGANTNELARLLTNPDAAKEFRKLATAEHDSQSWRSTIKNLLMMSGRVAPAMAATQDTQARTGRATGGAVGRMDAAAKRAQLAISRETTPLMDQSDEAVANALRIASGR
jgi:hypothetical protein